MKTNLFDNTNRIQRIKSRWNAYLKFGLHSLKNGIPITEIIATQFPFLFDEFDYPPILTIELTNICNLSCRYCDSPLKIRKKGFMDESVFEALIRNLRERPAHRVRLVGTGESTLHKDFELISKEIISNAKYVTLVTNGHWTKDRMSEKILSLGFGMVEFSIDAGDESDFLHSRNGDLNKVLKNLNELKELRDRSNSNTLINVRLMIRPSMQHSENAYLKRYAKMADSVFAQYVTVSRNFGYTEDVYFYKQRAENTVPRCTLPSKDLEIRYNGDVLLCGPSSRQIGEPGLMAGNITRNSIYEMWNGDVFKSYRSWHRKRNIDQLNLCKGCNGF